MYRIQDRICVRSDTYLVKVGEMFENTLIPVAYGERPEELRKIGATLKNYGARSVCLYHVHESGSFFRGSDISWLTLLQEVLEEVGLSIEVKRGEGHIASSIAETALFQGCDEIYMRAKRRWHIRTMMLGSVSQDLLRISDVPVFVHKIRPHLPEGDTGLKREDLTVLYATDLDAASVRPIPYIKEFHGSRCHILHVRDRMADPATEHRRRDAAMEELRAVGEELLPYFGQVTSEQRIGDPATQVLHVSEWLNADVVVLGRKNPTFLSGPMGDTAERVVNESKASIFLVP